MVHPASAMDREAEQVRDRTVLGFTLRRAPKPNDYYVARSRSLRA
jgi:hypothetical protein